MKTGVGLKLFRIVLIIIGTCSSVAAFEVKGLSVPESFIVDYSTGRYFISNVNGGPTEKNGAGFITRLNPDGSVAELKFIKGGNGVTLNAPKGLLLVGENLYVSDIDHVRGFNKSTGRPVADFNLTSFSPRFLNDLAADSQGRIYVTDMGTDRIFTIDPASGKADVFAEGAELGSPNGLVFLPQSRKFFLVTWGTGRLYNVGLKGGLKPASREMFANLDGVDFDGEGNIFFSSFTGGKIYRLSPRGEIKTISHGLVTPADISLDRKKRLILVPSFNGNRAFTLSY